MRVGPVTVEAIAAGVACCCFVGSLALLAFAMALPPVVWSDLVLDDRMQSGRPGLSHPRDRAPPHTPLRVGTDPVTGQRGVYPPGLGPS